MPPSVSVRVAANRSCWRASTPRGGFLFSALSANAICQDGDALFPLLAVDAKVAIVATIYNFLPAVVVVVALHLLWGLVFGIAEFGFGVL